jgi:hypothetical protein
MARVLITIVALAAALAVAGPAHAVGGNYVVKGGTSKQKAEVRAALNASAFDWGIVRNRVTIHISSKPKTYATRGHIVVDARLVDSGRYGWGFIQHEYAHQVDFFLFDSRTRARLNELLGGHEWSYDGGGPEHHHHAYGCERFASTLAWAYWPSSDNALRPKSSRSESAAMAPGEFRALLASLLRTPRSASR